MSHFLSLSGPESISGSFPVWLQSWRCPRVNHETIDTPSMVRVPWALHWTARIKMEWMSFQAPEWVVFWPRTQNIPCFAKYITKLCPASTYECTQKDAHREECTFIQTVCDLMQGMPSRTTSAGVLNTVCFCSCDQNLLAFISFFLLLFVAPF